MVQTILTQLQELAPPPSQTIYAGTPDNWGDVEKQIGTALPQDYKQLINLYGAGSFGGYVCILTPFAPEIGPGSHLNLFRGIKALGIIASFQQEAPESFQPFPVFPAFGGLLPWGTECQDSGLQCWHTLGEPDSWSSVILDNDWSAEYHEYSAPVIGFLFGWLTGQIAISYYPPFPLAQPLFKPFTLSES